MSHFVRDTRGATAIEYAMIASLISIAIVAGAQSIGSTMLRYFNEMLAPFL